MKIAIVGPSPIPFTIGGAERLMWGLCDNINQLTNYQAELIKVPVKENSFWDLIDSYYKFYKLDLSHFDMVITMKYPAWMVQHSNHICYMMHTLRGLYDTYHMFGLNEEIDDRCMEINELLNYMDSNRNPVSLDCFFEELFKLKDNLTIDESYFSFPGPLIRKIIHYLDGYALQDNHVTQYYSISDTVRLRKDYFPVGAEVKTVYPPSTLKEGKTGNYEYIFMVSRLDGPKRIDMLIEAMQYVKNDVKLFIAGTGPEREKLEKLAEGDNRIQFLGFVKDEDVDDYYANSLVIPYFPYDEDYGYITIEAMLHKKPVITTNDAGGPTEFVEDGVSGFVVPFDAKAIANKIDYYAAHPKEAKKHGEAGYAKAKKINWRNVVDTILNPYNGSPISEENDSDKWKPEIVLASTFSIFPPQGGGQARTFGLYKNLAKYKNVEIIAFDSVNNEALQREIAPGLVETRIPKSKIHEEEEWKITSKVGVPITDVAMIKLSGYTPMYRRAMLNALKTAKLVVISHPYLYPEIKPYLNVKYIYEAQDVEYKIKKGILPDNDTAKEMLADLYAVEKECCEKSELIMTCSDEDKKALSELYGIDESKIVVVPNGVDTTQTEFIPLEKRLELKKELGLENEKIGIFMGSWHGPNLEAAEVVFQIAEKCPDTKFMLLGSQCEYFKNKKCPENVGLLGLVSEEEKERIFSLVDFALNPMLSGSGTNLKMFDYMAAGIPIITTAFGTRGIDNKNVFIISDIEDMVAAVTKLSLKDCEQQINEAREYVEQTFDWKVIANQLEEKLEGVL